jgi:uncharacterized protein (UPF0333 family)
MEGNEFLHGFYKTFIIFSYITGVLEQVIRDSISKEGMVSRSLEKMLLIAIGLSTAVIVGVPLLMVAIQTLQGTSQIEMARAFAESTHNLVHSIDSGECEDMSVQVNIPDCATIDVDGSFLGIYCYIEGELAESWEETYTHSIEFSGQLDSGSYTVRARLIGEIIELSFAAEV